MRDNNLTEHERLCMIQQRKLALALNKNIIYHKQNFKFTFYNL